MMLRRIVDVFSPNLYSFSDVCSISSALQNVSFQIVTSENRRKYSMNAQIASRRNVSPPLNKSITGKQNISKMPRSTSASAYQEFIKLNFNTFHQPGVKASEVITKMGSQWNAMSAAEKAKYQKLAVEQSAVIRNTFLSFVAETASSSELSVATKRKLKSWLNYPKRPGTVYTTFIKSCMANRQVSDVQFEHRQALREAAKQWSSLSDSDKKPYVEKYNNLLAEYEMNLEEWRAQMTIKGEQYDKLANLLSKSEM